MTDLISRADAVKAICDKCLEEHCETECIVPCTFMEALEAVPSADAKTKCIAQIKVDTEEIVSRIKEEYDITDAKWIPCSERLPRTGDDILATFSDGEVDIIISARPKAWVKYEEANNLISPVAWMPLPEPYREDGENDGED